MPDNHNSKPRCEECKAILVKGKVLEGLAKIKCERCEHVNVLSVAPQRVVVKEHDTTGIKKVLEDRLEMAYLLPRAAM